MRYFVAIVLPPLAVLLCGKPMGALLNLFLTLLGWVPGAIHALFVAAMFIASHYYADKRVEHLARAMGK